MTEHTYERDAWGRPVGSPILSVTTVEPEFNDDDRAVMIALSIIEADECPTCHGSLSETSAADADDDWEVTRTRCHRCTSIGAIQERAQKDPTEYQISALLWSAHRRGH